MNYLKPSQSVIDASKRLAIKESLLNLLCEEKKDQITIKCGLKAMDLIIGMAEYRYGTKKHLLSIADCWVVVERDFNLDPWEIWYNDTLIFE